MKIAVIIIIVALSVAGIVFFLKRRSRAKTMNRPEFSDEEYDRNYKAKEAALERILGPMHNLVGHAVIPFHVGGAVDMYYFPNAIPGTAFATMELIGPDGSGPKPNRIGTYELIAFTKHKLIAKAHDTLLRTSNKVSSDEQKPFDTIERRMCGILTVVGRYSYEAVLNPGETCEMPGGKGKSNTCLIFDEYKKHGVDFEVNGRRHCLLLCIEVFRSEMEYAMKNGSAAVLRKLKEKGYYPYSDLDKEPVY